jgi:hypothetical protein
VQWPKIRACLSLMNTGNSNRTKPLLFSSMKIYFRVKTHPSLIKLMCIKTSEDRRNISKMNKRATNHLRTGFFQRLS